MHFLVAYRPEFFLTRIDACSFVLEVFGRPLITPTGTIVKSVTVGAADRPGSKRKQQQSTDLDEAVYHANSFTTESYGFVNSCVL